MFAVRDGRGIAERIIDRAATAVCVLEESIAGRDGVVADG